MNGKSTLQPEGKDIFLASITKKHIVSAYAHQNSFVKSLIQTSKRANRWSEESAFLQWHVLYRAQLRVQKCFHLENQTAK